MKEHDFIDQPNLKDIINIDAWTRSYIKNIIN